MPRQPRLDIPDTLHHVIVRGIEKRDIFADDDDRERFLSRLSYILTDGSTKCFAWALMSNHFHLLLMPTRVSLSETMRRLLTGYAVYFNRKYGRAGHLFQNRYKSILCEEEPYFLELVRYIHLNPIRAGLVSNLSELDRYPWSGHAVLVGNRAMEGQIASEVLARFGKGKVSSIRAYQEFMADGVGAGRRDELVGGGLKRSLHGNEGQDLSASDERILGSGEFVERLTIGKPDTKWPKLCLTPAELLSIVCLATGVDPDTIRQSGKERTAAKARAVFCWLAIRHLGLSGKEAGEATGLGSSGVSIAARRGGKIMQQDPLLNKKMSEILV